LRVQQFELPPQGRPSSVQPEPVGSRQRPGVGLPAPTVQSPVQQSFGPLQMSPVALQPEYAGWQVFPLVPVTQFVEQQSPATEQFSPSVLQPPLVPAGTGAQCAVASQMSEQHCEPSLHSDSVPVPLGRHVGPQVAPGIPAPVQLRLQQSVFFVQAYPSRLHPPPVSHWWPTGSHFLLQQLSSTVQLPPSPVHKGGGGSTQRCVPVSHFVVLQQSPSPVHASPRSAHCPMVLQVALGPVPEHVPSQQSVVRGFAGSKTVQPVSPMCSQTVPVATQMTPLHCCEQQSPEVAHVVLSG